MLLFEFYVFCFFLLSNCLYEWTWIQSSVSSRFTQMLHTHIYFSHLYVPILSSYFQTYLWAQHCKVFFWRLFSFSSFRLQCTLHLPVACQLQPTKAWALAFSRSLLFRFLSAVQHCLSFIVIFQHTHIFSTQSSLHSLPLPPLDLFRFFALIVNGGQAY